jgi:DNA polymerase-3 subunit delta
MTTIQPRTVDAFLRKPDAQYALFLVYGPDVGLVSERAKALVASAVDDPADPFQMVRLDGDEVSGDPARLADEAYTVPLFGGRRAIWVRAGGRSLATAVEPLLQDPPRDCRIVIEGGDWRKNHPLVAALDRSRAAAVIACHGDESASIAQIIADEVAKAGLTIAPDARDTLAAMLGGDRLASRAEVQKLCLYAHGTGRIETTDVLAIVGDATALAMDAIIDAAFSGRLGALDTSTAKAWGEGVNASVLAGAGLRHALLLHKLRALVDRGQSASSVVEGAGGMIHFKRKADVAGQLSSLEAARLEAIVADFQSTVLEARRNPALAEALVSRALMRVGLAVASRRR